jgi:chromate transporter
MSETRLSLATLAGRFLRIGAMGFGGPMALIGLMQERLVEKDKVVTPDDFATGVALGQMLPGPVAVDCATHIGYHVRGLLGACATTGALILPPFLLMLVMTPLYFRYGQVPQVAGFFKGVSPAIIAVIIMAGHNMAGKMKVQALSTAIIVLAAAGVVAGVSPVLLLLAAGLVGVLRVAWGGRPRGAACPHAAGSGREDTPAHAPTGDPDAR